MVPATTPPTAMPAITSRSMPTITPPRATPPITLSQLPSDVLLLVLKQCDDVQTVTAAACCSRGMLTLASDASTWSALLRRRHCALLGDDDPHLTLFPSAALVAPRRQWVAEHAPARCLHQWTELFRSCDKEWLSSRGSTSKRPRQWAWRLAFDAADHTSRQTMFALMMIRFAFGWHMDMALRFALAALCAAGCVATVYGTCSVGPADVCALVPFWEPGVSQPLRLA